MRQPQNERPITPITEVERGELEQYFQDQYDADPDYFVNQLNPRSRLTQENLQYHNYAQYGSLPFDWSLMRPFYYMPTCLHTRVVRVTDKELPLSNDSDYVPLETPLFAEGIKPEHVAQSQIGNCALLAPLLTIVRRQPARINACMQEYDGLVAVQLYDRHNCPIIFVLDKTAISSVTRRPLFLPDSVSHYNNHTQAWVHMIEKAYAAFHRYFGYDYDRDMQDPEQVKRLHGVDSFLFLNALLGKGQSLVREIKTPNQTSYAEKAGGYFFNQSLMFKMIMGFALKKDGCERDQFEFNLSQLSVDESVCNELSNPRLKEKLSTLANQWYCQVVAPFSDEDEGKFIENVTLGRCEKFFRENLNELSPMCVRKLLDAFTMPDSYQLTKRGNYDGKKLELFADIHQKLKNGAIVLLSSAEGAEKGLVGTHAYEVISCHTRQGGVRQAPTHFLLVRNPWGTHTRHYRYNPDRQRIQTTEQNKMPYSNMQADYQKTFGPLHAPATEPRHGAAPVAAAPAASTQADYEEDGVFELELNDFIKRFRALKIWQSKTRNQSTRTTYANASGRSSLPSDSSDTGGFA